MKKSYGIMLDIEPTENVKKWLGERGLTFSGWINSLVNEVNNELHGDEGSWMRKSMSELTVQEFGEGLAHWLKKMKEDG